MLTPHEQDIIRRWNEFYLKPNQGSLLEQRKRLADYFEEFNANPPVTRDRCISRRGASQD